jgi:hypothetical protein
MLSIPLTILGGSDRVAGRLPASGAGLHPLADYKGVAIRIEGRPLAAHLVERLNAAEGFGPVAIAGPRRVYGPLGLGAEVIDTDGTVDRNLRAAVEHHLARGARSGEAGPLAILACDVLPAPGDLAGLRARYEQDPASLWLPFVRVPAQRGVLGSFSWKPSYLLRTEPGAEPVRVLPGHLAVFDARALRMPLVYKLIGLSYRTRNRSIRHRKTVMISRLAASLVARDLGNLFTLRAPTLTVGILRNGLRLAHELRAQRLELGELEQLIARIFLRRDALSRGAAGVRFPLVDVVRLAEDMDTEEEVRELAGDALRSSSTSRHR